MHSIGKTLYIKIIVIYSIFTPIGIVVINQLFINPFKGEGCAHGVYA